MIYIYNNIYDIHIYHIYIYSFFLRILSDTDYYKKISIYATWKKSRMFLSTMVNIW